MAERLLKKQTREANAMTVTVRKTDTLAGNMDTSVRNTDTSIRNTDTSVRNAEASVGSMETSSRNMGKSVGITNASVRNMDAIVRDTDAFVRKTDAFVRDMDAFVRKTDASTKKENRLPCSRCATTWTNRTTLYNHYSTAHFKQKIYEKFGRKIQALQCRKHSKEYHCKTVAIEHFGNLHGIGI